MIKAKKLWNKEYALHFESIGLRLNIVQYSDHDPYYKIEHDEWESEHLIDGILKAKAQYHPVIVAKFLEGKSPKDKISVYELANLMKELTDANQN